MKPIKITDRNKGIKLTLAKDEIRLKIPSMSESEKQNLLQFVRFVENSVENVPFTLRGKVAVNPKHFYVIMQNESRTFSQYISNDKDIELTEEELLEQGMCPCGNSSYEGCSVTGCALYCYQELGKKVIESKILETWRPG